MEILFGIISGTITAMGMGGGTTLILLLTLFSGINQHNAQAINLIFFIPTSIVAIFINIKNKNIDLKISLQLAFFGIIGAIIGSIVAKNIDTSTLKKIFSIFLLIISFYEIYTIYAGYISNKKTNNNKEK